MKTKTLLLIISILLVWTSFYSCQEKGGTSYDDVRLIITTSCAVVGCHNSTTAESNIDCSTYASMTGAQGRKNILDKNHNNFYDRVLVRQNMPSVASLSEADKSLLQSWVDNNFKE